MSDREPRGSRPWLGAALSTAAGTTGLAGLAVRLSVRDALPASGMIFYATPWPVLASLLVLMAGGLRLRNRSPWTSPVAATGLIVMVGWTVNSHSNPPPAGLSDDTLSCLTWNTDHGQAGWDRLAQTIREEPTDMVCLVEAGPTEPELDRFWQDKFPNHVSSGLGSGMLVLVRNGTVRQTRSGSLADTVRFRQFDVCCRGHDLVLILADVTSTPWVSRQQALAQLHELATTITDKPVLITGDFNTPTDSAWFDRWRLSLTNAWEAAGNGFRPTWPLPLPLLDLDQCWGNRHVGFIDCHTAWSSHSDHQQLVTRFAVNPR